MKKDKDLLELLTFPSSGEEVAEVIKQLKHKRETMERISNLITIQVMKTINIIMNDVFVPQMVKMVSNKNLRITNQNIECDWVNTSYMGLSIENPDWKYFVIGIEFERRWLKEPIIGFLRKSDEYKREDIKCWDILKERYSRRDPKNSNWIYKSFKEQYDWHTPEAIDKIVNGKMVEAFEKEIDEILECAKEFDEI